jgi:hypothetical protein
MESDTVNGYVLLLFKRAYIWHQWNQNPKLPPLSSLHQETTTNALKKNLPDQKKIQTKPPKKYRQP